MTRSRWKRPNPSLLAYLGEVMDSAGYFAIRRRSYNRRVRKEGRNVSYTERVTIKKVDPELPMLLRDTFGGQVYIETSRSRRRKPLYKFDATELLAARINATLLPYLWVKRPQALLLAELRQWRNNPAARHFAWWWVRVHPQWRRMPMLTAGEVAHQLGYKNSKSVKQALADGVLIALPSVIRGRRINRRFPGPLIGELAKLVQKRRLGALVANPPQLMARYKSLYQGVRRLNALGRAGEGHRQWSISSSRLSF